MLKAPYAPVNQVIDRYVNCATIGYAAFDLEANLPIVGSMTENVRMCRLVSRTSDFTYSQLRCSDERNVGCLVS